MKYLIQRLDEIEANANHEGNPQRSPLEERPCVPVLQKIGEKLLTEYYIQFGSLKIEPLRVEAYYFHDRNFKDFTTYRCPEQKEYDRLFLHGPKVGREGVDICIGSGEKKKTDGRYLSFLIKDAIVTEKNNQKVYCKQTALYFKLKRDSGLERPEESTEPVLREKPKTETVVFHTARRGLSKKPFGRELLGSLIPVEKIDMKMECVGEKENDEYSIVTKDIQLKGITFYDFESNFAMGKTIAQYLKDHPKENKKENWDKWWKGGWPEWARKE